MIADLSQRLLTDITPLALGVLGFCFAALLWWGVRRRRAHTRARSKQVVLDGSNILYWRDGTPQIETVQQVVRHLKTCGYAPGVVFDANAGYLISGKYCSDKTFARLLQLPTDRVMVVPKGTPADPVILTAARDMAAPVISNDRFRDWHMDFPEIRKPGRLIQGGFHAGNLSLDLD